MADLNKLVEELSSLTVIEAAELSKKLEEKWGVSAAAPVAVAAAGGGGGAGRGGGGEDRVHGRPGRGWRQEDQRHQRSARDHRPRPERGQGSGRRRAEGGQGRRQQGRGGEDQEAARRRGCNGSNSIAPRGIALAGQANGRFFDRPRLACTEPESRGAARPHLLAFVVFRFGSPAQPFARHRAVRIRLRSSHG